MHNIFYFIYVIYLKNLAKNAMKSAFGIRVRIYFEVPFRVGLSAFEGMKGKIQRMYF